MPFKVGVWPDGYVGQGWQLEQPRIGRQAPRIASGAKTLTQEMATVLLVDLVNGGL
jgi:hypothetical protein